MKIADLETLDPAVAPALAAQGVHETGQLLSVASSIAGRAALAEQSGVQADMLLRLVHWSELMQLPRLLEGYCVLLDALGMATWAQLAEANAPELLRSLRRTNVELTAVRSIQPESILADWIRRAATNPSSIEL